MNNFYGIKRKNRPHYGASISMEGGQILKMFLHMTNEIFREGGRRSSVYLIERKVVILALILIPKYPLQHDIHLFHG